MTEVNVLETLSTTINIEREPFFMYSKNVLKIMCRLLIKNLSTFLNLYYQQHHFVFNKLNSLYFYNADAGDIYQGFRINMADKKMDVKYILSQADFNKLILQINREAETFSDIKSIIDAEDTPFDKAWEIFRLLILPIRINHHTIPLEEREFTMKVWMSTVFTLPLLDNFNERYVVDKNSLIQLRNLYKVCKIPAKAYEDTPAFDVEKLRKLESMPNDIIDMYVSPIKSSSKMDKTFRPYMYLSMISCVEIIRKPCLNLKECKQINPDYLGDCMHIFDDYLNTQIKKIQEIMTILMPPSE